jgi:hypothetical protein
MKFFLFRIRFKTFFLVVWCLFYMGVNLFAQDDGTTTNNWNSMPDLAPTAAGWDFALTPAWYFWFGMGIGVFVGLTGAMVKAFQTITGAGDSGGES